MDSKYVENIIQSLEEYEVVCDECACNDGTTTGKQLMQSAAAILRQLAGDNKVLNTLIQEKSCYIENLLIQVTTLNYTNKTMEHNQEIYVKNKLSEFVSRLRESLGEAYIQDNAYLEVTLDRVLEQMGGDIK